MKRGVVFSITAVLVASFFAMLYFSNPGLSLGAKEETARFRVTSIDRFANTFNEYAAQAIRVTTFRSLNGMVQNINTTSTHFPDTSAVKANFTHCMLNGTVRGANCSQSGTAPATLPQRLADLAIQGKTAYNLNVTYNITNVTMRQQFPFHVTVTVNYTYTVRDQFAALSRSNGITEIVSIEGVRDPLFNRYVDAPSITRTNTSANEWNNDTLAVLINKTRYRYHNTSPSFLQRMSNGYDTASACCGIETVLSEATTPITFTGDTVNASGVDHLYYEVEYEGGTADCNTTREVEGLGVDANKIQIDEAHLTNFNVSNDLWKKDCDP